jgi:ABC-type antimicrobial peptide transport system permease subunit
LEWSLDNDAAFPLRAQLYEPFAQLSQDDLSTSGFRTDLVVRADHPDTVFPDIQSALRRMNQEQVAYRPKTMNHIVADTLTTRRFSMVVLGVFAGLALLLASVGLYGVISYIVSQRMQEMAIRMALGADRRNVLLWVLKRGGKLAGTGTAAGAVAALLLTRIMASSSMLYAVSSYDPLTMIGGILILMFVALAACYIPARRAASIDPMKALRAE